EVRDEHARGATMLRIERFAAVREGDPGHAARDVLERDVRRVATVAELDHVLRGRLDAVEQRVDGDALPVRVELRPLGDTVDVDGDLLPRQRTELLPRPAGQLVDFTGDREVPLVERGVWGRARRQDREIVRDVLAGWNAVARRVVATTSLEATGDD